MLEHLCRICAKDIQQEKDSVELFDKRNKKLLLQIKDLAGVRLRNSLGLPKLMCCDCKENLISAYKFREDFLKVQASFKIKCTKGSKKQTSNEVTEETEFIQVFVVKEEKNTLFVHHKEDDYGADEEKEINIESQDFMRKQNISLNKESRDEINVLELNPNEENALENTKISIENICDKNNDFDTTKSLSEDDLDKKDNDGEDSQEETKIRIAKEMKSKRKRKKTASSSSEIENFEIKREITKSRKKRKDAEGHSNIFICDQCGNHFTCRHHFKLHLRRHSGDKRCACELCPDKFFTSSELRRHMRRHTGERPFACKYCDRRFTDYSTRIKHERTHTNERPFMCSHCGKSFTTSYILKNHMLTHTGERHFKCDVCNKAFTRRTHLVVHFRSIMHKQAVEKDKRPITQDELPQTHCLIPQSHVPTFLV